MVRISLQQLVHQRSLPASNRGTAPFSPTPFRAECARWAHDMSTRRAQIILLGASPNAGSGTSSVTLRPPPSKAGIAIRGLSQDSGTTRSRGRDVCLLSVRGRAKDGRSVSSVCSCGRTDMAIDDGGKGKGARACRSLGGVRSSCAGGLRVERRCRSGLNSRDDRYYATVVNCGTTVVV